MSNSCNVRGCEHTSLRGKGSVSDAVYELTLVREELKEVCDRRKQFLEDKVVNFMNWLIQEKNKTKEESRHVVVMMNRSVLAHLKAKEEENMMDDGDSKLNCTPVVSVAEQLESEQEEQGNLEGMYHAVAYKAWCKEVKSGKESTEKFEEACDFLEMLEAASDYVFEIRGPLTMDKLDAVPVEYRAKFFKYFKTGFSQENIVKLALKARQRSNSLNFNLNILNYYQWAYIYNWCSALIGSDKQYGDQQELWEAIHASPHSEDNEDVFENAEVIERTVSAE